MTGAAPPASNGLTEGAAGGVLTPQRLIMGVFFLQALLLANWLPRIPDVETALALSHGQLAIAMVGMPVGVFMALAVAGPLIERASPRRAILAAFPVYCAGLSLIGWAWSGPALFVALMLFGAAFVFVDVAMNVEAARIEAALGRRIMNTCHGFWSVGSMVGALMSGAFAELGVVTGWHLLIVGVVSLPVAYAVIVALPSFRPLKTAGRAPIFALPSLSLIGLCLFIAGVVIIEVVARNWGGVFLRDVLDASPAAIGIAIGAFAFFMAIGRFLGDRLSDRFGTVVLARACGVLSIAGVLLFVTAGGLAQALAGFVAMGLGASVGFPLAVTAAATRGDRPPATNVAALALFAHGSALVGPTMVGLVSEEAGLRIGFATILPLMILSTLLAGHLARRRASAAQSSAVSSEASAAATLPENRTSG